MSKSSNYTGTVHKRLENSNNLLLPLFHCRTEPFTLHIPSLFLLFCLSFSGTETNTDIVTSQKVTT